MPLDKKSGLASRADGVAALQEAQAALDAARLLPCGHDRFQALKEAGLLRSRALDLVLKMELIEREKLIAIKAAASSSIA